MLHFTPPRPCDTGSLTAIAQELFSQSQFFCFFVVIFFVGLSPVVSYHGMYVHRRGTNIVPPTRLPAACQVLRFQNHPLTRSHAVASLD